MTMHHTSLASGRPYRREDRRPVRVPVVLPVVDVTVDDHGSLTVTLDGDPCTADDTLGRSDLQALVDTIAHDLGSPVRVEVHEHDGSSFTDIVTPAPVERAPQRPQPARDVAADDLPLPVRSGTGTALASVFGISGEGFTAGEEIEICLVFARQVADEHGTTQLRLPPAALAAHPRVALIGRTSGVIAISETAS